MTSYPSNTAGIIQALIDLQTILSGNSGVVVTLPVVAGESISAGQAVYLAGDGLAYKGTNASSRAAAAVLGFAKTTVSPGSNLIVIGRGRLAAFSGLYPGQEYYLALDGGITATPPNGGGVYLVNVGQALSSTELDVDMQPPVLLV